MTDNSEAGTTATLGDRLRTAREARGMSLRETADKLCLLAPCVQAMEENNYGYFRAAVFAKGYLRNYVKLLELDEQRALAEYEQYAQALPPEKEADFFVGGKRIPVKRGLAKYIVIAASVIVAALLAWWLMSQMGKSDESVAEVNETAPKLETTDLTTVVDPLIGSSVLVSDQQTARMQPSNLPEVIVHAAASVADSHGQNTEETLESETENDTERTALQQDKLTLAFAGDCWIKVVDYDGNTLLSDLKRADEKVTVTGQGPFNIVIGNAPAVTLSYNGQPVAIESMSRNHSATLVVGDS